MLYLSGPIIQFDPRVYYVNEPIIKGDVAIVKVRVVRLGDVSQVSVVRVSTKSGSSAAGTDFNSFNEGEQQGISIDGLVFKFKCLTAACKCFKLDLAI